MRNLDSCRCWRCTLCPCKVRNKFLVNFWHRTILLCIPCISSGWNCLQSCAMAHSYLLACYSRGPGWSWASLHEIGGDQSGTWTGFSMSTLVFPCQYHATGAICSLSSTCNSYQKDKRQSVGTSKNQCCCGNRGALDRKVLSLFFVSKGASAIEYSLLSGPQVSWSYSCYDSWNLLV